MKRFAVSIVMRRPNGIEQHVLKIVEAVSRDAAEGKIMASAPYEIGSLLVMDVEAELS